MTGHTAHHVDEATQAALLAGERYAKARTVMSYVTAFIVMAMVGILLWQQAQLTTLAHQNRELQTQRAREQAAGNRYAQDLLQQILSRLDTGDRQTRRELVALCNADDDCPRQKLQQELPAPLPPSRPLTRRPESEPTTTPHTATFSPRPSPTSNSPTPRPSRSPSPSPSPSPTICVPVAGCPVLAGVRSSQALRDGGPTPSDIGGLLWMLFSTRHSSPDWTTTSPDWRGLLVP